MNQANKNTPRWSVVLIAGDDLARFSRCISKLVGSVDPQRTELLIVGSCPEAFHTAAIYYCDKVGLKHTWQDTGFDQMSTLPKDLLEASLEAALGEYLVVLTDDTLVCDNFLVRLAYCVETFPQESKLSPVGLVVPVSNATTGRQSAKVGNNDPALVDSIQRQIQKIKGGKNWSVTGTIIDFCVLITRDTYNLLRQIPDTLTFDTVTTWPTKLLEHGCYSVIDASTYIYKEIFLPVRQAVLTPPEDVTKKLGVLYRVRIDDESQLVTFVESLEKVSTFADGIFILDDNSKIKLGIYFRESKPDIWKVVTKYEKFSRPVDEKRDRNQLLQWAETAAMDWVLSLDGDEIVEDKVDRDYVQKLMKPPNQKIFGYICHQYFFWGDTDHWRMDNLWGQASDVRFSRLIKGSRITLPGNVSALHGFTPQWPLECIRDAGIRIKCYGFMDPIHRLKKQQEHEKTVKAPAGKYDYLTSEYRLVRYSWLSHNTLSVYAPVGASHFNYIDDWLDSLWAFADEIVLGLDNFDIQPADRIRLNKLGVKIKKITMGDNFAEGRNQILQECGSSFILQLDIDERVEDWSKIRRMLDITTSDAWTFRIDNLQRDGTSITSETVRLFKNTDGVSYWGFLHETIDDHIRRSGWRFTVSPTKITHYGYLWVTPEEAWRKMQRYIEINLKQIEQHPHDGRAYYNLALHLLEDNLIEDAIRLLTVAAGLPHGNVLPAIELGKTHVTQAHALLLTAVRNLKNVHPAKEQLTHMVQTLHTILPRNTPGAPGHCLAYFSQHPDKSQQLHEHLTKVEGYVDDVRTKKLENVD